MALIGCNRLQTALLLCSLTVSLFHGGIKAQELRGGGGARRMQASPPGVLTGMQLIDSTKNVKVADLVNGTIVYLDAIGMSKPTLNVNVTVNSTTGIGSVLLQSNMPGFTSTVESAAPYALCGNKLTDFYDCSALTIGTWYTVTATSAATRSGVRGSPLTVSFMVLYTNKTKYELKNLSYAYDAYEPYIDAATMNLHHSKHHGAAVNNLNKATENSTIKMPLVTLMENALNATAIRNNGGSHYNHALFWSHLAPFDKANKTLPSAQLSSLLTASFGGLDAMKLKFNSAATTLFGSGWVWLVVNPATDRLEIVGTPNQDNPLMKGVVKNSATGANQVMFPILGLDVWEHAYYLKHNNRRADYVATWWNVVDWDKVSANCAYVIANRTGVDVQG